MPYSSDGTFSVINTFTPSTTILSSEANANNADFADGLSDVLVKDGRAPMLGQLQLVSGDASTPGLAFDGDTDTGVYRPGANTIAVVTSGADRLSIDDDGVKFTDGTEPLPSISFIDDPNTGIRRVTDDTIAVVTSGTDQLIVDGTNGRVTSINAFRSDNGTFEGISGGGNCILATVGLGTIRLRPQGRNSASGEVTLAQGGTMTVTGSLVVNGSLSKGSGTFNIAHPLDSEKRLVHGFVEAPRYDLIYRGTVQLRDGCASVDIDAESGMSPGAFGALSTNAVVCALQNQNGFARVMAGPIANGRFEIMAENELCNDEVAWVVIAERNDPFVKEQDENCDSDGRLIVEHAA